MDLHPGEQIVFEGHPSWRALLLFYLSGVAIAVVVLIIGVLASGWALGDPARGRRLRRLLVVGFVKRMATDYVITTERLHIRRGMLSKRTQETRVQRVQNVNTEQTLFARIMRIGTVDFDTAGTDDSEFRFVGVGEPGRGRPRRRPRPARRAARRARPRRPTRSQTAVADLVLDALALDRQRGRCPRPRGCAAAICAVEAQLLERVALERERLGVGGERRRRG